nr:hypothetical protein [Tanacetum cinerariifolium]
MRLGHINFKTMNKLVRKNLVRGLPTICFENDHTCVACQKGKQHKTSCKTKTVSSISQPLQMLHMDLFGPTFVKSLMKKMYCLVVTDDISRFSWVFFLATKDDTSGILKAFIKRIENLIDHKVKIIRCDNGTEFKNKEMNLLCEKQGIKIEFSVARTPQHNEVAKKNRTLIEAVRTMLADSKLPTTFWAEAVNTTCYVQIKVLVIKPHNKNPYELFYGRTPSLSFMRLFGYPVTILNTLDHLGKFHGKAGEAFILFNIRTKIVEDTLDIIFLENKPNVTGSGQTWLFDIDTLTKFMNYKPVVAGNQSNGSTSKARDSPGDGFKPLGEEEKKKAKDPANKDNEVLSIEEARVNQEKDSNVNNTNIITTISPTNNTAGIKDNDVDENIVYGCADDLNMPNLEEIVYLDDNEDVGAEADMTNLDTNIPVSPILTTRIHKDHPVKQIIEDIHSAPQTKRMSKSVTDHVHQMDVKSAFLYGTIDEETIMATSTTDAEYVAAASGCGQVLWIQNQLLDYGDCFEKKLLNVDHIQTDENVTDLLTKPFDAGRFQYLVYKLATVSYFFHCYVSTAGVKFSHCWDNFRLNLLYWGVLRTLMISLRLIPLFWSTARIETTDEGTKILAIVDGKPRKISESSIRRNLKLKDEVGISSLPNAEFFKNLTLMGYIILPNQKFSFQKGDILKKFGYSEVRSSNTPMDKENPWGKDRAGKDVDLYLYRSMIGSLMYLTASRPSCLLSVPEVTPKESKVYKVEKAMYGLHQAPRAWYGTLSKYLLKNGFQRGTIDQTLFIRRQREDFILVQGKDGPGKDVELHLYRSMIGSLMYLTASKPDIMFAVCAYARHQVTPKECHLHAVKRIFRYLKGHPNLRMWYPKASPFDLMAYSDSDYGGASQDRKSTTEGSQFWEEG